MKQIFSILTVSTMLFACTSTEKKEEGAKSSIFIENKVQEFINANPNWSKDEATQEATTEKFKHAVINWSNEADFLKGMPLQLKALRDTSLNETPFKVATFTGYNDTTRPMNSLLNYIQLQVDAIVPPDVEKNLQVQKNYNITADMYKQGKRADVKYISVADFKGYDLGKYLFSLRAVSPIEKK